MIGAGADSLWVAEVPSDVGTFLMMRIAGAPYEFEEEHRFGIKLIDPERDEQELLESGFGPMDELPPSYEPGIDPGILIPAAIGWHAEHFGLYTLEVHVDGKRNRSIPIRIRDAAELQQPPGSQ
jgi:uncharacterized protein DUF6941